MFSKWETHSCWCGLLGYRQKVIKGTKNGILILMHPKVAVIPEIKIKENFLVL